MERAVFVPDLDRLPPPGERYDRLYLGSEFCVRRLPQERELRAALAQAERRGMSFTLVTPFLDEPGLARTLDLVRSLPDVPAIEVVANDLGLLEALREAGWKGTLVAGRLLTRQRRGPGFQSFGDVPVDAAEALRGSALDSPAFVALLADGYGVRRFELDDLVQGTAVPTLPQGIRLSLYRPWLLVTATRNCPWVFDGRSWDRDHCARPCRGRLLRLIPEPAGDGSAQSPCVPLSQRGNDDPLSRSNRASDSHLAFYQMGNEDVSRRSQRASDRHVPLWQRGKEGVSGFPLVLGGCAQFLEHRGDAPPPPDVDRIVWQPEVPA
jgi:hypothetical protein